MGCLLSGSCEFGDGLCVGCVGSAEPVDSCLPPFRLVLTLLGTNKHQAIFTSAYRGPLLATLGFAACVLGRPSHLLTLLNFLNSFTQEQLKV